MQKTEFYSHMDDQSSIHKTMEQHLREVVEHAERSLSQLPPRFSQNAGFRSLVAISCLFHDFGKFTTYFQDYLSGKGKQDSKHHHGFISAMFTAFQVGNASLHVSPQIDPYLPLISYLCVLHHHGDLENLDTDIIRKGKLDTPEFSQLETSHRTNLKNARFQLADIQEHRVAIEETYGAFPQVHDLQIDRFSTSWMDLLRELDKIRHRFEVKEDEEVKRQVYICLLILYSILIDSDKKSAAEVDVPIRRKKWAPTLVDEYRGSSAKIDTASRSGINQIRNEIYSKAISSIDNMDIDTHIMTLTAPTGTGKTLAAISAAFRLREKVEKQKGFTPRIIYSLPFTSIIDQNFDVIADILSLLEDYPDNQHEYLLKHHHLSSIEFKKEGEEMEPDHAMLLIESWESEIVVTTFVQLLQTVVGFKNKHLKKYHKLAGSIIVLDEVQNIPVEYWPLVSNSFKLMCQMLDCYVILLTATKPLLFSPGECFELIQDNIEYFSYFNRTRLNTFMEGITLDDMVEKFLSIYDERLSYMIVANTIKSSLYLYKKISELINTADLYYLSSNIVPKFRRVRIEEISSALKQSDKPILISTQVVEAGVDLDFDRVIRDLGPIDSVVQVAGRCNRSGKSPTADVYIFNIIDDRKRSLSTYVYGVPSTNSAKSALATGIYEEERYYTLVNEFFQNVKKIKSHEKSDNIWKAMTDLCFCSDQCESVSDFSLIESLPDMVDVFVQADETAKELWEYYEEKVLKERDIRKRRQNFAQIKSNFHLYIISIPRRLASGLVPIANNFYLLPYEGLEQYYDHDTGFKRVEEETTWIL